jgi:hypothetical protein
MMNLTPPLPPAPLSDDALRLAGSSTNNYVAARTALLIVDLYRNFTSDSGKLHDVIKETANASKITRDSPGAMQPLITPGSWVKTHRFYWRSGSESLSLGWSTS